MAQRRMFSSDIVCSDEFLNIPVSSRDLYYQLAMKADDDGFIQPKMVIKITGATNDDLQILIARRFLIAFENGVIVIKHWLIHNMIRADRYKPTRFQEEKKQLKIKENKAYTEVAPLWHQSGTEVAPQVRLGKVRLGKVRLGKDNTGATKSLQEQELNFSKEGAEIIKAFEVLNPAVKKMYGNKTQREACDDLIKNYSLERVLVVIEKTLAKTNGLQYFPTITTPLQLRDKWASLESAITKKQSEIKDKNKRIVI